MEFYTVLLVAHTILVLFLIIIVLLQRTESDGLGGLGGGGGGGNQFMTGRGSANFMTRTTAMLAAGFMVTSLALASIAGHMTSKSIVDSVITDTATQTSTEAPVEKTTAPVVPKPE
ncbi:MAG: preprotein translocase subunit SecG [Rickettsiales bacterium]|jgi:preprotein translocase subunit SecG